MKKSTILYILIFTLLLSLLSPVALAAEDDAESTEETTEATQPVREPDQCGEDMVWAYEDGILTITGNGLMDDFPGDAPWDAYREEITQVIFSGEVTYIGAGAFDEYDALKTVDFGDAIYELGTRAFYSCDGLTELELPASFKIFGEESLRGCSKLKAIHCAGRFPSFRLNCLWDTYVTIYFPANNPWGVEYIQQLEEAFKGRVEFLASDGSDPYVPTEPTEETTEPTEEATEETTEPTTEPTTVPTEETTQPTTVPATEAPTEPSTGETTRPTETTAPTEAEAEDSSSPGSWVGFAIIGLVLAILGLGVLIFKPRSGGGKYSRR